MRHEEVLCVPGGGCSPVRSTGVGCVGVMSKLWYPSPVPECTQSVVSHLDHGGHVVQEEKQEQKVPELH